MPKLQSIFDNFLNKNSENEQLKKQLEVFAMLTNQIQNQQTAIKEHTAAIKKNDKDLRFKSIDINKYNENQAKYDDAIAQAEQNIIRFNKELLLNKEALEEHKISQDKLIDIEHSAILFHANSNETNKEINQVLKENSIAYKVISSGLSKVGLSLDSSVVELFGFEEIVRNVGKQLLGLNEELARFQRSVGGAISSSMLGFTRYGNNNLIAGQSGSLETLAARYNFSKDDFFSSLQGFAMGNVMGMNNQLSTSPQDLKDFGIQQAKIIRMYGVSSEAVATLGKNMTQLYGVSIQNLNQTLINSKDIVHTAGLSVKQFFQNFAELSSLIGQYYIRGGIQGMQNVAQIVTKLNISVQDAFEGMKRLNTIQDLFQKQNQAVALGLTTYASNVARIFAMQKTGDIGGSIKARFGSLAQDMLNMGYIDRNRHINQQGLETLQYAGFSTGEIQGVQRMLIESNNLGVSLGELSGQVKMTAKDYAKVRQYEFENATMGEKLKNLWQQLKSLIIDPLAAIAAPILDILINITSIGLKSLYMSLLFIIKPLELLGKLLTLAATAVGRFTGLIDFGYNKKGDETAIGKGLSSMNAFATAVGNFLPVLMLYILWEKKKYLLDMGKGLFNETKNIGGLFKGTGKGIRNIFRKRGASKIMLDESEAAISGETANNIGVVKSAEAISPEIGLRGLTAGSGFGLAMAGNIVGGFLENSQNKKTASAGKALSWGGTGAMIGNLVFPGVGALIGGTLGVIGGYLEGQTGWFSKMTDHLFNIDEHTDPSNTNNMSVIMAAPAFAGARLASNILNKTNGDIQQTAIKAQEKIMQNDIAQQHPPINITIPNIGILGKGMVKARFTGR